VTGRSNPRFNPLGFLDHGAAWMAIAPGAIPSRRLHCLFPPPGIGVVTNSGRAFGGAGPDAEITSHCSTVNFRIIRSWSARIPDFLNHLKPCVKSQVQESTSGLGAFSLCCCHVTSLAPVHCIKDLDSSVRTKRTENAKDDTAGNSAHKSPLRFDEQ